jgi:hypothetical protein
MSDITTRKTNRIWWGLLAALAIVVGLAGWRVTGRMMSMDASAAGASQYEQYKPGDTAKVVIEVTEAAAGSLTGKILERENETVYKRTGKLGRATFSASTKVLMGKPADIKPEAVLHITGTVGSDHILTARQVVVLTGYVRVE